MRTGNGARSSGHRGQAFAPQARSKVGIVSVDGRLMVTQTAANGRALMNQYAAASQLAAFIVVGEASAARSIPLRARRGSAPGLFCLIVFNSALLGTNARGLDRAAADHRRA